MSSPLGYILASTTEVHTKYILNICSCFWIMLPAYMTSAFSREILQGLEIASEGLNNQVESPLASFKEE